MSGNATEEGLLGQIGNPSHSDPSRVVALSAFVAGAVAYMAARWSIPRLTVWGGIVIGALVCIVVAWRMALWFQRRQRAFDLAERNATRARQIAETDQGLAALRQGVARKEHALPK